MVGTLLLYSYKAGELFASLVGSTSSSCSASSSPAGAGARAMSQPGAAMRRAGALVLLAAASGLVLFFPAVGEPRHVVPMLSLFVIFLLGCAALLLSPAHRSVADLARRAAEAARWIFGAPGRAAVELPWAGFTCIAFCAIRAAGNVGAGAGAAEKVNGLLLLLVLLVGVWAVSLSMLTGIATRTPPPADELDGGEVSGIVASKV